MSPASVPFAQLHAVSNKHQDEATTKSGIPSMQGSNSQNKDRYLTAEAARRQQKPTRKQGSCSTSCGMPSGHTLQRDTQFSLLQGFAIKRLMRLEGAVGRLHALTWDSVRMMQSCKS